MTSYSLYTSQADLRCFLYQTNSKDIASFYKIFSRQISNYQILSKTETNPQPTPFKSQPSHAMIHKFLTYLHVDKCFLKKFCSTSFLRMNNKTRSWQSTKINRKKYFQLCVFWYFFLNAR